MCVRVCMSASMLMRTKEKNKREDSVFIKTFKVLGINKKGGPFACNLDEKGIIVLCDISLGEKENE